MNPAQEQKKRVQLCKEQHQMAEWTEPLGRHYQRSTEISR